MIILTIFSLFTDETKTEYKSTRQLLQDISEIYQELTDKDQAGLLEALAGKRQGQIVAAILNNMDTVVKLAIVPDNCSILPIYSSVSSS